MRCRRPPLIHSCGKSLDGLNVPDFWQTLNSGAIKRAAIPARMADTTATGNRAADIDAHQLGGSRILHDGKHGNPVTRAPCEEMKAVASRRPITGIRSCSG